MVYVLGGRSTAVAVDFLLGRGTRDRWAPATGAGNRRMTQKSGAPSVDEVASRFAAEVERAFAEAPPSAVVALESDPAAQFEMIDLLCAHKYVMEHQLQAWIARQNVQQGVAPSREQVMVQLPACISTHAPLKVRDRLRRLAAGSPRKQRKWLARFRRRWGARFGVLQTQEHVCVEERRQKVFGLTAAVFFLLVPDVCAMYTWDFPCYSFVPSLVI